jgi:hypothetical protein
MRDGDIDEQPQRFAYGRHSTGAKVPLGGDPNGRRKDSDDRGRARNGSQAQVRTLFRDAERPARSGFRSGAGPHAADRFG